LEKHVEKLSYNCWIVLSSDPLAIDLLKKHQDKIIWEELSRNPAAIALLEQHPENIHWSSLSANPNAAHLLFKLDHVRMREQNESFKEELMAYVFEPCRLMRLSRQFGIDFRIYLQIY
jgi:hypothetical protein